MKHYLNKIFCVFVVLFSCFVLASCGESLISAETDTCYVGSSIKLEVKNENNEEVIWEVSDSEIAKIEDGLLTGLKAGNVTVKVAVGEKTGKLTIKVKEKVVERETLFCGSNLITENPPKASFNVDV